MSEQFKKDLYNYEVTPPPGTWQEIARKLKGNDYSPDFAQKMYDYEVSPPPGVFHEILGSLASQSPATRLPGKIIQKPLPHLVAAASLFGVILMSSLYLFYSNGSKKLVADSQKNTSNKNNREIKSASETQISVAEPEATESGNSASVGAIASVYNQREKKNYNRGSSRGIYRTMVRIARTMSPSKPISIAAKPIRNQNGDIIQDPKILTTPGQKYISITGPNGQQTKISAKFNNLLLYLNTENDIEDYDGYFDRTFLESLMWKSRFKHWREKIIKTTFIPTSTNYMDILEFKDLISKDVQN